MKKIRPWMLGVGCSAGAIFFSGCYGKVTVETPPEEPAAAAATPAPATPPATTPAPVAVATPAPDYLAPPGVFFLITKASIETNDGITGLPPGTRLQQAGPTEYTTPDGARITLLPNQVTNDLRIARTVAGADAATQAALREAGTRPSASTDAGLGPTPQAPNLPIARATPPPVRSSTPTPTPAPTPAPGLPPPQLGSTHSRVKDGYLWQQDAAGNWNKIRQVR